MANLIANVTVRHVNSIPEDSIVNTWAFQGGGNPLDQADDAVDMLTTFYNATIGGNGLVGVFGSNRHMWQAPTITFYDLAHLKPRQPIATFEPTWANPPSGFALPFEVAVCMSFNAAMMSGSPPARRRGRIFFGPVNSAALDSSSSQDARPTLNLRQRLTGGAAAMIAAGTSATRWGVYSRVDGVIRPVVDAWTDNAFDTQRRRGVRPTARTGITP